jgi:hypothetical protein
VRNVRLWRALLGVDQRTVIEDIEFEGARRKQDGVSTRKGTVSAGKHGPPFLDSDDHWRIQGFWH